jgi:glycerophosphoryl diester phosphodiesterase
MPTRNVGIACTERRRKRRRRLQVYDRRVLRLYAHRGASAEAPENTMPSFRRALEIEGVDALELDVHMTRDGHPVVSHDPTAERMAGKHVAWKDIDLAEARSFDMGWGFQAPDGSRPFAGQGVRIPTFEEVLAELPAVALNVDIKQYWPPMVRQMVSLVRQHDAEERVVLASFQYTTLLAVRALRYAGDTSLAQPEVVAVLAAPRIALAHAPLFGTCAQVPVRAGPVTLASRRFLDRCHDLGIRVDFWTINDPAEALRLLELGADGIMTDDPETIAPVFARWRAGMM